MAKYYAWSDIYNGGDVTEVRGRNIVVKRNMIACGEQVTQAKAGVSDEDWDALIAGGSIRDYPLPENIPANESPSSYVTRMQAENLELDSDILLKMNVALVPVGAQNAEEEETTDEKDSKDS